MNSFSLACTTFVGQNYVAGRIDRCKKTIGLCLADGMAAEALAISVLTFFGHQLLALFNSNSEVSEAGYVRLMVIVMSHVFTLAYEVMSGYMRGRHFGCAGRTYDAGNLRCEDYLDIHGFSEIRYV